MVIVKLGSACIGHLAGGFACGSGAAPVDQISSLSEIIETLEAIKEFAQCLCTFLFAGNLYIPSFDINMREMQAWGKMKMPHMHMHAHAQREIERERGIQKLC